MSGPSMPLLRTGLSPARLMVTGFVLALAVTPPSSVRAGEAVPVEGHHANNSVVRPHFDVSDETATLEAVHFALSQIGDGSSYVWHRRNGRLSGIVHPTSSFKDATGKVCRHIVLELSSGDFARRTEGIACRLHTGVWQLEG
jgi:surface antigen